MRKSICLILILLTLTSNVRAETCEQALNSCILTVDAYKDALKAQEDLTTLVTKQRNEAYEKLKDETGAPRLPFYVWIVLGAAAGVVVGRMR